MKEILSFIVFLVPMIALWMILTYKHYEWKKTRNNQKNYVTFHRMIGILTLILQTNIMIMLGTQVMIGFGILYLLEFTIILFLKTRSESFYIHFMPKEENIIS